MVTWPFFESKKSTGSGVRFAAKAVNLLVGHVASTLLERITICKAPRDLLRAASRASPSDGAARVKVICFTRDRLLISTRVTRTRSTLGSDPERQSGSRSVECLRAQYPRCRQTRWRVTDHRQTRCALTATADGSDLRKSPASNSGVKLRTRPHGWRPAARS